MRGCSGGLGRERQGLGNKRTAPTFPVLRAAVSRVLISKQRGECDGLYGKRLYALSLLDGECSAGPVATDVARGVRPVTDATDPCSVA